MINCTTTMSTIIEGVEEVIVGPYESNILAKHQRCITVQTKQGETFNLILRADEQQKLEFKDEPAPGWLTPKVYKGKSMHEMEMDGEE
jgi:hypothetical protein